MGKQDEYRFNLRFDESDEDHRRVCEFLNSCGRKKARYVVKAFQAYWAMKDAPDFGKKEHMREMEAEPLKEDSDFVSLDDDYTMDQAEIELMKKNYAALAGME